METERLILRRFDETDYDAIFAMRSNAQFMRFIKTIETYEQSTAWVKMVSDYWDSRNFGYWATVERATNQTIGWCGVWNLAETGEPEIGFAVAPAFWGKGYAVEAAQFAVDYSFESRGAQTVCAVTRPDNLASRRVMGKIGMRFAGERYFHSYGLRLVRYVIGKEDSV